MADASRQTFNFKLNYNERNDNSVGKWEVANGTIKIASGMSQRVVERAVGGQAVTSFIKTWGRGDPDAAWLWVNEVNVSVQ